MKILKYITVCSLLFIASLSFFNCNKDNLESQNKSLTPELAAKFHNEAVQSIITDYKGRSNLLSSSMTMRELLVKMKENMAKTHPEFFSNVNIEESNPLFNLDQKISDFNYADFYTKIRSLAVKKGIDKDVVSYIDGKFNNSQSRIFIFTLNKDVQEQIKLFDAVYTSSKKLWTQDAPKSYLFTNPKGQQRGCDAVSQVVVGDAVGTTFGVLMFGPLGPLFGGAVSLLVRKQQLDNHGSCI